MQGAKEAKDWQRSQSALVWERENLCQGCRGWGEVGDARDARLPQPHQCLLCWALRRSRLTLAGAEQQLSPSLPLPEVAEREERNK